MALVLCENYSPQIKFGVWKIVEDEAFYASRLIFSKWEKNYIDSITHADRRLHWLASRYLLKELLNTNNFVELLFDTHGKPFIKNLNYKVSITHCTEYAAVIVSEIHDVGIDIEDAVRNIENIKFKFLSQTEISQLQPPHIKKQLLVYWSAKEVMYKIYGKRKLEFKEDLFVKPFNMQKRGDITGILMKNGNVVNFNMHYFREDAYSFVIGTDAEIKIFSEG